MSSIESMNKTIKSACTFDFNGISKAFDTVCDATFALSFPCDYFDNNEVNDRPAAR